LRPSASRRSRCLLHVLVVGIETSALELGAGMHALHHQMHVSLLVAVCICLLVLFLIDRSQRWDCTVWYLTIPFLTTIT
jgi:hypothetical protein